MNAGRYPTNAVAMGAAVTEWLRVMNDNGVTEWRVMNDDNASYQEIHEADIAFEATMVEQGVLNAGEICYIEGESVEHSLIHVFLYVEEEHEGVEMCIECRADGRVFVHTM